MNYLSAMTDTEPNDSYTHALENMFGSSVLLHLWGTSVIENIQALFQNQSQWMLFLSHVGDPRFAFTIYFPVTYYLHRSVGKRVLWVAVLSEWLNAVAKWLMHGERPYWWVGESGVYPKDGIPTLQQFSITCETGPGSPSGHAMISSSVWYVMVSSLLHYQHVTSRAVHWLLWSIYTCLMCAICVSRLFIATHFPHQVIAGIIIGIMLAKVLNSLSTTSMSLTLYVNVSVCLSIVAALVYCLVVLMGVDPLWSVAMATKWCAIPEWVNLDTTLFYSLVRDVSSLLGLGVAVWLTRHQGEEKQPVKNVILQMCLALTISHLFGKLNPPHGNVAMFYTLGFLKHFTLVILIVAGVSRISVP